jgi:prepilin-type N-terminal cleavage/methylation domain-containing protein
VYLASRHRSQNRARVRALARRAGTSGFTLTELLVVVVIMGVLATLGFASLHKEVNAAWGVEGVNMVQSIRGAEERWRAEHMMYLDVSKNGWYPMDPTKAANRRTQFAFYPTTSTHSDATNWLLLRPAAPGPVRFGYQVNAGHTGDTMTAPAAGPSVTWPTPTDNWYVIQALGDTNGNGIYSYYRASSLDGDVFVQNPGE